MSGYLPLDIYPGARQYITKSFLPHIHFSGRVFIGTLVIFLDDTFITDHYHKVQTYQ